MDVHELQALSFSEALSRLEEKVINTKKDLDDVKAKAIDSTQVRKTAEELALVQKKTEEKLTQLREEKSFDSAGRNHGIMTEVIVALDNISEKIQKMLHLL